MARGEGLNTAYGEGWEYLCTHGCIRFSCEGKCTDTFLNSGIISNHLVISFSSDFITHLHGGGGGWGVRVRVRGRFFLL